MGYPGDGSNHHAQPHPQYHHRTVSQLLNELETASAEQSRSSSSTPFMTGEPARPAGDAAAARSPQQGSGPSSASGSGSHALFPAISSAPSPHLPFGALPTPPSGHRSASFPASQQLRFGQMAMPPPHVYPPHTPSPVWHFRPPVGYPGYHMSPGYGMNVNVPPINGAPRMTVQQTPPGALRPANTNPADLTGIQAPRRGRGRPPKNPGAPKIPAAPKNSVAPRDPAAASAPTQQLYTRPGVQLPRPAQISQPQVSSSSAQDQRSGTGGGTGIVAHFDRQRFDAAPGSSSAGTREGPAAAQPAPVRPNASPAAPTGQATAPIRPLQTPGVAPASSSPSIQNLVGPRQNSYGATTTPISSAPRIESPHSQSLADAAAAANGLAAAMSHRQSPFPPMRASPPSDAIAQAAAAAAGLAAALSTPQARELSQFDSRAHTPTASQPPSQAATQSPFRKVPIYASPMASPTKRLDLSRSRSVARVRPKDLEGDVYVLESQHPRMTPTPSSSRVVVPSAPPAQPAPSLTSGAMAAVTGYSGPAATAIPGLTQQPTAGPLNEPATAAAPAAPVAPVAPARAASPKVIIIDDDFPYDAEPAASHNGSLSSGLESEFVVSREVSQEGGSSPAQSSPVATSPKDRVVVELTQTSPVARRRTGRRAPIDRVQVVVPISHRRRDELIARGVYDPFRDDADVVLQPVRPKRLRPFVSSKVVSLGRGVTTRVCDPDLLPDRFHQRGGPGLVGPYKSVITPQSLVNRMGHFPCGWKGCDSYMASENLLERHVLARGHAAQGAIKVGAPLHTTLYRCYWQGCDRPCYTSVANLLTHLRAKHISRWLVCPIGECDLRSPNISHLRRHVETVHDDEHDVPRPRVDQPNRGPDLDELEPLPVSVRTDELTTQKAKGTSFRHQRLQDIVRGKIERLCWAPPDPDIYPEHAPHMMEALEAEQPEPLVPPIPVVLELESNTSVSAPASREASVVPVDANGRTLAPGVKRKLRLPSDSPTTVTVMLPRKAPMRKRRRRIQTSGDDSPPRRSQRLSSVQAFNDVNGAGSINGSKAMTSITSTLTPLEPTPGQAITPASLDSYGVDELDLLRDSSEDKEKEKESVSPTRAATVKTERKPRLVPFVEIPIIKRRRVAAS